MIWSLFSMISGLFLLLLLIQIFVGMFGTYIRDLMQRIKDLSNPIKPSATVDGKKVPVDPCEDDND